MTGFLKQTLDQLFNQIPIKNLIQLPYRVSRYRASVWILAQCNPAIYSLQSPG